MYMYIVYIYIHVHIHAYYTHCTSSNVPVNKRSKGGLKRSAKLFSFPSLSLLYVAAIGKSIQHFIHTHIYMRISNHNSLGCEQPSRLRRKTITQCAVFVCMYMYIFKHVLYIYNVHPHTCTCIHVCTFVYTMYMYVNTHFQPLVHMSRRIMVLVLCVCLSVTTGLWYLCVSVCLSVTTLAATSVTSTLKMRYVRAYLRLSQFFNSWIFNKSFHSEVMA